MLQQSNKGREVPELKSMYGDVYKIQENSQRGSYTEAHDNFDLMRIVVVRLGTKGEKSENPMIRLLGKLFSQTISKEEKIEMLSNEFNIAVTETINQEVTKMCNLSAGIYDRGVQKGIQEGKLEALCSAVKNAMESFHLSMEDAMNGMKISKEDQDILRKMIKLTAA